MKKGCCGIASWHFAERLHSSEKPAETESSVKLAFFSIIIPAIIEKYLNQAVESVCASLSRYEILLVDDVSTVSTVSFVISCLRKIRGIRLSAHLQSLYPSGKPRSIRGKKRESKRRASGEYLLFLMRMTLCGQCYRQQTCGECHQGYDVILFSSLTGNVDRDRYGIDMQMRDGIFRRAGLSISGHFGAAVYKKHCF